MTYANLYPVVVRMLHDPALVDAVYADAERALADLDLAPAERAWLTRPDRRAYCTDPMRRARALTGLMEEFPATSAFLLRGGKEGVVPIDAERLDAFFSDRLFHGAVRCGQSMVFAFARFLQGPEHAGVTADPRAQLLARLEESIARLRRQRLPDAAGDTANQPERPSRGPARGPSRSVGRAPHAEVLELPAGTQELYDRIRKALAARGRVPLESLLDPRWSLPVLLDVSCDEVEYLLLEAVKPEADSATATRQEPTHPESRATLGNEVRIGPVTEELGRLLLEAGEPCAFADLAAYARQLGCEPGEEDRIIDSLLGEGLLTSLG